MLINIKRNSVIYVSAWMVDICLVFCSYYIVDYYIPTNLWVYLGLCLIVTTLVIFAIKYMRWTDTANSLFRTIITEDDKTLYINLTNEFGLQLGEYIYYKSKAKNRKKYTSRKKEGFNLFN